MKQSTQLKSYLGGGVAAITASSAHGEILTIDINSLGITGTNAGLTIGSYRQIDNFPFAGAGSLTLRNGSNDTWGLIGGNNLIFSTAESIAQPTNFTSGMTIGVGSNFGGTFNGKYSPFAMTGTFYGISPEFGPDSHMGFATAQGNYGWLEVTWDPTTKQFEILSGAYESVAGVAIAAGDTGVSAIPETSSVLGLAGLVVGSAFLRRRKAA